MENNVTDINEYLENKTKPTREQVLARMSEIVVQLGCILGEYKRLNERLEELGHE